MKKVTPFLLTFFVILLLVTCTTNKYFLNSLELNHGRIIIINDKNETDINDEIDFNQIEIEKIDNNLKLSISTYSKYNLDEFFLYINTNETKAAEIAITCKNQIFIINKTTSSPGYFNEFVFSGEPIIEESKYTIIIPIETLMVNTNEIGIWIYSMKSKDRTPDENNIIVVRK